jgi:four helix bundle protein
VRDHRTLIAFQLADQLALIVYRETRLFPREETFNLTSQMRKAAVSIPSNIVEGCARHTEPEYLRFLDTAYGSTRELEYQISLATRLGYLPESSESMPKCEETGRVIHGLIESMRPSHEGKTRTRSLPHHRSTNSKRDPGGGGRPRNP